ncbi:apolipoprotein N-acyltransferase [Colwellia sp. 1_MG-2023]|nr:apolipoprotein N-acyltransferase [Colwellia sp. 1_MG-2023]MDO6447484.1 apolipoprotein N-acyltransferase [Colwellia sp. 1_MG-2023]
MSVLFFYLAFPSGGFAILTWFTMVPIIIALSKVTLRNAFMLGLLSATLGWLCSIWWAVYGVAAITFSAPNIVLPIVFIFCLISAIPYACACWLHVRFQFGQTLSGAFFSATIFTVVVNYVPHILPGNLAHALYLQPIFTQLADLGGVALVFFLIHCINILIANGISLLKTNKTKSLQCFVMALVLFMTNLGYGFYKKYEIYTDTPAEIKRSRQEENVSQEKSLRLAIVQPNINITNRTRADWLEAQEKLKQLLLKIEKEQNIDLIVFPEVPVPISYRYYKEDQDFFKSLLKNTSLLLTSIKPLAETDNNNAGYFNTMELIEENSVKQDYAKQVLLPFGEYLPFEKQLPWLREIFPFAPNYQPGNQSTLFEIKNSQGSSFKAIPLICYEAVFSGAAAKGVDQGGEFLINSSNDAWFYHTAGKRVHLALSLFRSIEYRKYLVRTTNTGLTAVIGPFGNIIKGSQIKENIQGYSVIDIPINNQTSFYQQHPNLIKNILLLLSFSIVIFTRKKPTEANI